MTFSSWMNLTCPVGSRRGPDLLGPTFLGQPTSRDHREMTICQSHRTLRKFAENICASLTTQSTSKLAVSFSQ